MNSKYPRAQAFLDKHPGWTVDDGLDYLDSLEREPTKTKDELGGQP